FQKSQVLYNVHHARGAIRKNRKIILFEGFMDVIAAGKAGVDNALATMGTSLTSQHIRQMKRFARKSSFALTAMMRVGKLLSELPSHSTKIISKWKWQSCQARWTPMILFVKTVQKPLRNRSSESRMHLLPLP